MTPAARAAQWTRLKTLFATAYDLDDTARTAFLESACADDPALRTEVEALLEAGEGDDAFLVPPDPAQLERSVASEPQTMAAGTRVGRYEILALIATGGMGDVYLARRADEAFEKRVALKVIRQHLVAPRFVERFERERQALAHLDHSNITRLLDGGTTDDGLPYLVMEHVDGRPIDRHCDAAHLPVRARLELFAMGCAAVQYAHRSLVVHRDLKPGNILVTDDGGVKLLDFGIASLLEEDGASPAQATMTALRALTPEYASPEQIRGEPVTTATDVYSLGVVLYELLSGQRPYRLADVPRYEADRIVCEVDPCPPSAATRAAADVDTRPEEPARLRRLLAGDLDNIVLMAMRKDPARRYATVQQLGEDVRRFLDARPVRARRDTFTYRAAKLVQRNKPAAAAAAIATAALIVALVGVSFGLVRARAAEQTALAERNAAETARSSARESLRLFEDMLASANPYRTGRSVTVLALLEEAERRAGATMADRPEVEADVRLVIGRTYANLMMWPRAAPNLRRALTLLRPRRATAADDLAIAEGLSLLGRALTHLRDPGSIELQREGLAIRRRVLGALHPLVAESTGNLGFALWASRDGDEPWAEAEAHYLAGLELYERLDRAGCHDAARLTMSLGYMYWHQGRGAEAETMYRRALAIYDDLPVVEDRYEFATLGCYATLLAGEDRFDEAAALLERYRAAQPSAIHGWKTCAVTWRLARLHALAARPQTAAREYATALSLEYDLHAEAADAATAARLHEAAAVLRAADPQTLYPGVRTVLDLLEARYRDRPLDLTTQLHQLAGVLRALGHDDDASALERDADDLARRLGTHGAEAVGLTNSKHQPWSVPPAEEESARGE